MTSRRTDPFDLELEKTLRLVENGALHRAAEHGSLELVQFFMRNEWDLHGFYEEKVDDAVASLRTTTPLINAVLGGDYKIVSYLLQRGACPDDTWYDSDRTALHYATENGRIDLVEMLLHSGASINKTFKYRSEYPFQNLDFLKPIHAAAAHGRLDVLKLLMAHGASLHDLTRMEQTALHYAAAGGHVLTAEFLITQLHPYLDMEDISRNTSLHAASATGRSSVAKLLVENGARLGSCNEQGLTPLHLLVNSGLDDVDLAVFFIQKGESVHQPDKTGSTPLHSAASSPCLKLVRLLHENGANVNARDNMGRTPLHRSCTRRRLENMKYLVQHNADTLAHDRRGYLPIHYTFHDSGCWAEGLDYLIHCDPDSSLMEQKDSQHGSSCLYLAVLTRDDDGIALLLQSGSNANAETNNGRTPLHLAVLQGREGLAEYLIDHGANVNARDIDGETPLLLAASRKCESLVRGLINRGANVNVSSVDGDTPLHRAASAGSKQALCLLEHGADVNVVNHVGRTPFLQAASFSDRECMSLLLDCGANAMARDNQGHSALHRATLGAKHVEDVAFLLQKGLDPNVLDSLLRSPLHYAVEARHPDKVRILLEYGADPFISDHTALPPILVAAVRRVEPEISYMLLKAAGLRWLEPSGHRKPLTSLNSPEDHVSTTQQANSLPSFLVDVLQLENGDSDVQASKTASRVWKKITWIVSEDVAAVQGKGWVTFSLRNHAFGELMRHHCTLTTQGQNRLMLFLRLIIEIAAASNQGTENPGYQREEREFLEHLDNVAVTTTLNYYTRLSIDNLWSLALRSTQDAKLRQNMTPGRYLQRWRRFMTDILRTRNCETRVFRALQSTSLPVDVTTIVLHYILDLEQLPRESQWKRIWSAKGKPRNPDSYTPDPNSLAKGLAAHYQLTQGKVVFDPLSRQFAWVSNSFGGAVYRGYEPTLFYDSAQDKWYPNKAHLATFGQLLVNEESLQRYFQEMRLRSDD